MIQNLVVTRGDTLALNINVTVDGAVVDITGWTFMLTIKLNEDDTDVNAKIWKNVTTHPDPTHGRTVIIVTPAEIDALVGDYYYDIEYRDSYGSVKTPMEGIITFGRDVTRRTSASGYSGS